MIKIIIIIIRISTNIISVIIIISSTSILIFIVNVFLSICQWP